MPSAPQRPVVLLAEDSEDDAFFFRWTLKKSELNCELLHAPDGLEALRILQDAAEANGQRRTRCPDLVFLDLKMPGLTGFELLEWIRAHPFQPPLEVAVLSGSNHTLDVERAKALGAQSYLVKPVSGTDLRNHFQSWQRKGTGPALAP